MKKVLLIVLVFLTVISCNSLRHYEKVATDTQVTPEKKAIIAPWVSTYFPSRIEYVKGKDSIVTKIDSSFNEAKVDSLIDLLGSQPNINIDSLKQAIKEEIKPIIVTRTIYHTDTTVTHLEESERFVMQKQINDLTAQHSVDVINIADKDSKISAFAKTKLHLVLIIVGAGLLIVILLYLLFKPSLKLPSIKL